MAMQYRAVLAFLAFWLSGCAHVPQSVTPPDGLPAHDISQGALLVEDPDYPLLLRGVDGVSVGSLRLSSVFGKQEYLIQAGRHLFWVKGVPYGHPLFPQRVRCYVMEGELAQGGRYRLKEEVVMKRALLLNDVTGATETTGRLVDEPWIFLRDCRWQGR